MKFLNFIGLVCCSIISTGSVSQKINYGNNASAGRYFDVGNCKLYFEVYGEGKPVVLLHGGVYGYIDEFEPFLEKLRLTNQVICIATRAHGKSEIGHAPFSYSQRAEDAYKIIRSITKESVTVLGFSDGGFAALKLAALHPELVNKLITIGAGDLPKIPSGKKRYEQYTRESLMKYDSTFFKSRLALMPEPNRWAESLSMLNDMYNNDFVSVETFSKIKCPTLIMAGDRDEYTPTEDFVKCRKAIRNSQLAIIAGCGHVIFYCNFPAVWDAVEPFLK